MGRRTLEAKTGLRLLRAKNDALDGRKLNRRETMKPKRTLLLVGLALAGAFASANALAQITNTVFSEDFSGPLDTNKLIVGTQSLEGGTGTIVPTVANG